MNDILINEIGNIYLRDTTSSKLQIAVMNITNTYSHYVYEH